MRLVDLLGFVVEDRLLTGRSRNSVGWRQKNWSSASSPATYIARPGLRRPARPHIWRSEVTVPGKVTQSAASRSPMSMPSSSASVATTASRSPGEPLLELAPLRRRVAGAVGRDALRQVGRPASSSRWRAKRWISSTPRRDFRKQIVRIFALDELGQQVRGLAERGGPPPQRLVHERRVPHGDLALRSRRPSRSTSSTSTPVSRSASSAGSRSWRRSRKRGSLP